MDIAAVLIALVAGGALGWALTQRQAAASRDRLHSEVSTATAAAGMARVERDGAAAELTRVRDERDVAAAERRAAEARLAEAATLLKTQQQVEEELKKTFATLSSDALRTNQRQFMEMADDRFKLAGVPIAESLDKVGQQLGEIERNRVGAQAALKEQIEFVRVTGEQLKIETASLVSALRKPQARGQWGEHQLRNCVKYAGMIEHCDFNEQTSVSTADGRLRPDMIINLAGGKTVVVDAKVTLVAYLEAHEASDETTRAACLVRHARHLRQHIDSLSNKAYWTEFSGSPEFVIMFVPGDGPLNAALEQDPTLLEYATSKGVQILGPMSLIPTLRVIGFAWQQQALADNAREVFDVGRELYRRLGAFGGHMSDLGRRLSSAVGTYNKAVGSLEGNVLVQARRLNELDVVEKALPELEGIDDSVRPLSKPELVESADAARSVVALPTSIDDEPLEPDRFDDYGIDAGGEPQTDRRTGS